MKLREAAMRLVEAQELNRDAINGMGHEGEPHDKVLHPDPPPGADFDVFDITGDCSACGGAQYGTEDALTAAYAQLRFVLGLPLRPWEAHHVIDR